MRKIISKLIKLPLAIGLFLVGCVSETSQAVSCYKFGNEGPLIVVLGGSEGGYPEIPYLRDALRSRDFSVAEVAYFGYPNGPKHLQEISIENVSKKITDVSYGHDCVGIFGVSKGAELALVLAAYQPVSDLTVAMVPSNVVWQSSRISLRNTSSWTLGGKPLDFLKYDTFSIEAIREALDVNDALALHMSAIEGAKDGNATEIPVERVDHPVLLQSALHDQIWPTDLMSMRIMERLERENPYHQFILKRYDHDHYLLQHEQAYNDLLDYFSEHLSDCSPKDL